MQEESTPILYIGEEVREAQTAKLQSLRERRSAEAVERTLAELRRVAAIDPESLPVIPGQLSAANTMPAILDCVRAYCTVGEICEALRDVYGSYTEASWT